MLLLISNLHADDSSVTLADHDGFAILAEVTEKNHKDEQIAMLVLLCFLHAATSAAKSPVAMATEFSDKGTLVGLPGALRHLNDFDVSAVVVKIMENLVAAVWC